MENYINQLLEDIENAYATDQIGMQGNDPTPDSLEAIFDEMERFVSEDPSETLSHHLGLTRVQFPDDTQLTEQQCAAIFKALTNAYQSYGVALGIPSGIPVRKRYQTAVAALEKAVYVSKHGMFHVDYCHYDFDGYCPFGEDKCPCFVNLENDAKHIDLPVDRAKWDYEDYDTAWYQLLTDLANTRNQLEEEFTPNRSAVKDLYACMDQIWIVKHRDDYAFCYRPEPEDVPVFPGRTLAEWAECQPIVFPPFNELHSLEAKLLTLAMLRLLGKNHFTLSVMVLEQPSLYDALVQHFGCELRRHESDKYWELYYPPGQPTIYELVKEQGLDQWVDDMTANSHPKIDTSS